MCFVLIDVLEEGHALAIQSVAVVVPQPVAAEVSRVLAAGDAVVGLAATPVRKSKASPLVQRQPGVALFRPFRPSTTGSALRTSFPQAGDTDVSSSERPIQTSSKNAC